MGDDAQPEGSPGLRRLLDDVSGSADVLFLLGSDGAIVGASAGAAAVTGREVRDLIGCAFDDLSGDHDFLRVLREEALQRGSRRGVIELSCRDGRRVRLDGDFVRLRGGETGDDHLLACLYETTPPPPTIPELWIVCERIAHDIRGLLAPITVAVDLLREIAPHAGDLLDTIDASVEAGTELARSLLQGRAQALGAPRTEGGTS